MLTTPTPIEPSPVPPLSSTLTSLIPASPAATSAKAGVSPTTIAELNQISSPFAQDWWVASACRTVPDAKDLFFSEELTDMAAAKRICADCPVIAPCLEEAIHRGEPCGVWGGQLFDSGRIVMIKRRRGRPPKNPRPEDQLPMIPVPEHLQKLIA
ncbi:MAG: WhiB family transcriptional regulator [Acidimicrobiales bacterium]